VIAAVVERVCPEGCALVGISAAQQNHERLDRVEALRASPRIVFVTVWHTGGHDKEFLR
jgi:hypothetical protein